MKIVDINSISDGYTHDGCFHADDVMATVLLLSLNPSMKIHRVNFIDESIASNESNIVYDVGLGRYDHHQQDRKMNKYGFPYSAFGLLWEDYGLLLLKKRGFKKEKEAFWKFREDVVSKIDQGDNCGYENVEGFYENYAIKRFNASWYELKDNDKIQDEQFDKAVQYATLVFDNMLRKLFEEVEMPDKERKIFDSAIKHSKQGIAVLKENIPWRDFVKQEGCNVKIVISKNLRGGFNVTSVNSNVLKIVPNRYLSFVHPSGFMGVAKTLRNAKLAARNICLIKSC
ncbi:MAG: MYG1 family protein [Clostridiales bacterium]|nr:MYG1 family protein [Clostridiales bacterium]